MNSAGWFVITWCVATFIGLIVQLFEGMPQIGFWLFIFGAMPACIVAFWIRFNDDKKD